MLRIVSIPASPPVAHGSSTGSYLPPKRQAAVQPPRQSGHHAAQSRRTRQSWEKTKVRWLHRNAVPTSQSELHRRCQALCSQHVTHCKCTAWPAALSSRITAETVSAHKAKTAVLSTNSLKFLFFVFIFCFTSWLQFPSFLFFQLPPPPPPPVHCSISSLGRPIALAYQAAVRLGTSSQGWTRTRHESSCEGEIFLILMLMYNFPVNNSLKGFLCKQKIKSFNNELTLIVTDLFGFVPTT